MSKAISAIKNSKENHNNSLSLNDNEEETSSDSSESEGYVSDTDTSAPPSTASSPYISPKKWDEEEIIEDLDNLPSTVVQKIKDLENAVNFHATNEKNYLKMLGIAEAKLDSKDLEIEELKTIIKELKKDKKPIDSQSTTILNPSNWVKANEKISWRPKRDNLLKILKDNLSPEEIKEEFGDIYGGWENDIVVEVMKKEDKKKLTDYDKLVSEKEKNDLTKKKQKELDSLFLKPKKEKLFTFICDICEQEKTSKLHQFRINGIGFDPKKYHKICDYCIDRVDWIKEEAEDFF